MYQFSRRYLRFGAVMNNLLWYFKWGAFSFTTFSFLSDGYFAGVLCEGLAKGFSLCLAPGGVQLVARGPHAAQDGCECGPTQNPKFI